LVEMERDVVGDAEVFDEALVGVRLFATEAVVNVDGGEADAEGFACSVKGEEESGGVCSTGDGYAETVAWLDVGAIEGQGGFSRHSTSSYRRKLPAGMMLRLDRDAWKRDA
jgi:hypothetical protein